MFIFLLKGLFIPSRILEINIYYLLQAAINTIVAMCVYQKKTMHGLSIFFFYPLNNPEVKMADDNIHVVHYIHQNSVSLFF